MAKVIDDRGETRAMKNTYRSEPGRYHGRDRSIDDIRKEKPSVDT
jgi:hypothetical protein